MGRQGKAVASTRNGRAWQCVSEGAQAPTQFWLVSEATPRAKESTK
jgi:hypothetical protein